MGIFSSRPGAAETGVHYLRPDLATWLALTTVLLVSLAVGSVSLVGTRFLAELADAEARARAELGASSARETLRQELDEVRRAAALLAARPTLRQYLAAGDADALEAYMTRYCAGAALGACAVLQDGAVLRAAGLPVDWAPVLPEAAGNPEFLLAGPLADIPLLGATVTVDGSPDTAVIVLRPMDRDFMARVSESVGLETSITLARAAADAAAGSERGVRVVKSASDASDAAWYVASAPAGGSATVQLELQIRLPAEEVMAPVAALERRMWIIAFAVTLLAAGSAILIGRYWIRGVQRLTRAARRIGSGHLDVPVPRERGAELGVLGDAMEQVRRNLLELKAARRIRDTILANISHEFRTPLAAQLASIELLRDEIDTMPPEAQAQLVRSLEHGAHRLAWLIDNLLESVRIESGQLGIRRQPVSMADVVDSARQLVEPLLDRRGQALQVDGLGGLPRITGDRERLVQVFVNLLANASKFSPRESRIRVAAESLAAGRIRAWVEDEGPGPELAGDTTLFEAFRRSSGDDPEQSGLGLGLYIVKSIVERHGGRVWLARTVDGRTRASLELPEHEAK
jgi:signal transduction histidine kinase